VKGGALTEVTFFVLLAVHAPRHGYAVMQFVEERTAGRLRLGAGSLYGAISALVEKGWAAALEEQDGRKKEYLVTNLGRQVAQAELERLRGLVSTAEQIMEEAEHEEDIQVLRGFPGAAGALAEQLV